MRCEGWRSGERDVVWRTSSLPSLGPRSSRAIGVSMDVADVVASEQLLDSARNDPTSNLTSSATTRDVLGRPEPDKREE